MGVPAEGIGNMFALYTDGQEKPLTATNSKTMTVKTSSLQLLVSLMQLHEIFKLVIHCILWYILF